MAKRPNSFGAGLLTAAVLASGGLFVAGRETAEPSPSATPTASPTSTAPGAALEPAAPPTPPATQEATASPSVTGVRIEPGTYILWKKSRNLVVLVRDGVATRTMPTTDLDWKTPVGDYRVLFKNKVATTVDGGVFYRLPHFASYGPVPGHTDIGFHGVPVTPKGRYIQPLASVGDDSGRYASHGCQRLRPADAKAVWDFAAVGTQVRVR